MPRSFPTALVAVAVILLTACGSAPSPPARAPSATFERLPSEPTPADPLVTVAVRQVQVALDDARAAGFPGPCRVVHVWVAAEPQKRSWANPSDCRIQMDESVTKAGGWWFRYQARHEVAHIVTRALDHHDQRFRCVESALVARMGQTLVYGDDPEGYPVRIQRGTDPSSAGSCRGSPVSRRVRRRAE